MGVWACSDSRVRGGDDLAAAGGGGGGMPGPGGAGSGGGVAGGGAGGVGGGGGGGFGGYDDPSIWQPIAGSDFAEETCRLRQADPDGIRRQFLDWQPCGEGCETASLRLGFDIEGVFPVMSSAEVGGAGHALLTATFGFDGQDRQRALHYSIRLDDGLVVSAAQLHKMRPQPGETSYCGFGISPRAALAPMASARSGDGPRYAYGAVDPDSGRQTWFAPWRSDGLCNRFPVYTDEGPVLFFSCGSAGFLAPDAEEPRIVAADAAALDGSGASWRDTAVWSEFLPGGSSRIRSWQPAHGVRTLVDSMEGITCQLALSSTTLVGVRVDPAGHCDTSSSGLRLWHTRRADDAAGIQVVEGPTLATSKALVRSLSGWNDHAAAFLYVDTDEGRDEYAIVARLSDGVVRRIDPQPGHSLHHAAIAVSERYVFWGERAHGSSVNRIDTLYRWDLAELAELGKPLDPGVGGTEP